MRTPSTTLAGQVGKYAKFALVVFYAVQLAVLFREQIVHFYRSSTSTHLTDEHSRDRSTVVGGEDAQEALSAVPTMLLAIAEVHEQEASHIQHGNEGKDRARRHRRHQREELYIENLFALFKKARPHESCRLTHAPNAFRHLDFAAA